MIGPWCDYMGERLTGMRTEEPTWRLRLAQIAPGVTAECDRLGIKPPWDEIDGDGGLQLLAWNLATAAIASVIDRSPA